MRRTGGSRPTSEYTSSTLFRPHNRKKLIHTPDRTLDNASTTHTQIVIHLHLKIINIIFVHRYARVENDQHLNTRRPHHSQHTEKK